MSVDFIEDKYQEDQGQSERGGVMALQNVTNIDLYATTESFPMSVDTVVYEYTLTRAPVDATKPSSQPAASMSSSSIYTSRTASKYTLYPSSTLAAALK